MKPRPSNSPTTWRDVVEEFIGGGTGKQPSLDEQLEEIVSQASSVSSPLRIKAGPRHRNAAAPAL